MPSRRDTDEAVAERDAFSRLLMQGLMPKEWPTIPGASLAAHYAPALAADAGGDFWDCLRLGDASYVLALGDAVGKGPRAAALMSVVRHSIRSLAQFESRPSRLLFHLNAILLDKPLQEDMCLCTVAIAGVQASRSHLRATLSLGGHPPPLVIREDGTVQSAGALGTILGVTAGVHHGDQVIDLLPGDALVLFTDGLVEQRGLDQELEERRLHEAWRPLPVPGRRSCSRRSRARCWTAVTWATTTPPCWSSARTSRQP